MKLRIKLLVTVVLFTVLAYFITTQYIENTLGYGDVNYPLKYTATVEKYSELYGVEKQIIYATILCESDFEKDAVSPRGAVGLMQITPETFRWLCTKTGEDVEKLNLSNPDTNIKYGTFFLSMLYGEFGDATLVHAAYNAGRGRIKEWMKNGEYYKDGELYYIPFAETRNYVERIKNATENYTKILEVK